MQRAALTTGGFLLPESKDLIGLKLTRGIMPDLKKKSHAITTGPNRAPARSMLKAVGFTDEDLRKPIVGVASTWIEIGPCNYHLRRLAVG